ncbi:MAG: hypothetical protein PHN82_11465 [bacterium]|nr:hypothetical protein [bacterium]
MSGRAASTDTSRESRPSSTSRAASRSVMSVPFDTVRTPTCRRFSRARIPM